MPLPTHHVPFEYSYEAPRAVNGYHATIVVDEAAVGAAMNNTPIFQELAVCFTRFWKTLLRYFPACSRRPSCSCPRPLEGLDMKTPTGGFSVSISVGVKTVPRSLLRHPLPISARRNDWKLCQTLDTAIRPDGRYAMQTFAV